MEERKESTFLRRLTREEQERALREDVERRRKAWEEESYGVLGLAEDCPTVSVNRRPDGTLLLFETRIRQERGERECDLHFRWVLRYRETGKAIAYATKAGVIAAVLRVPPSAVGQLRKPREELGTAAARIAHFQTDNVRRTFTVIF